MQRLTFAFFQVETKTFFNIRSTADTQIWAMKGIFSCKNVTNQVSSKSRHVFI